MNRYGKRCVLYPRVSTEMQVDGYSLEGQKNMLTRFADREEMIVVDTYEDAGKSGKSIEGRPAFQKMLRDIEDGLDIDYILVYKLSRFGRNAADILNSLELVQSYGVNLICIEEGIDSSQTSGKLLISVLSAVAEIERENIIEQTMNGRREKARQGGWNGGFAPYGYTLEDNKLMIEETEAVAIRKIFELYTSSEIGLGGIANQLNLQGIRKIPRQNGTLEDWTGHFIKLILDNPVYCGKIAYGRRTKEKVKGTKNDYQMKRNDDYILTEGQHKGIVSEEVWEKAHAKRLRTGVKQPSKIGRDRVHLLSGLLKCPVCGSPMYTNKHAWTNKDGTYKEIYYYVCSRNRMVRGKHCEYKAMLKKTDIEPMVIEAIREIVRNEEYAQAIKERIGVQIDTKAVDKELEGYSMKYEAMKHQGKKGNGSSLDEVGEAAGESGKTVQRYIWLARLSDELLDMVDKKKIGLVQGVDISFLTEQVQEWVQVILEETGAAISTTQSSKLKEYGKKGELTLPMVRLILTEEKPKERKVTIKADKISRYFTEDYSSEDIENIIYQLLEEWQNIFGRDLGASIMRLPSLELLCRRLSTSKKIKMEQSH